MMRTDRLRTHSGQQKKGIPKDALSSRAADRIRTDDNHVGNVMLCQLSYSRDAGKKYKRPAKTRKSSLG